MPDFRELKGGTYYCLEINLFVDPQLPNFGVQRRSGNSELRCRAFWAGDFPLCFLLGPLQSFFSLDSGGCLAKDLLIRAGVAARLSARPFRSKKCRPLHKITDLRHASLKVATDIYMQAVDPQKREAQSNLVKLVRKGAVLEIKPA